MTPAAMQMFFNRDYSDYPDIKTRYVFRHPAEIIKNLRELLIKQPEQENWAKQLLVFIETSPLYQLGYQRVVNDEEQKAKWIEQLHERNDDPSAVEDEEPFADKARDFVTKIFQVEEKKTTIHTIYPSRQQKFSLRCLFPKIAENTINKYS